MINVTNIGSATRYSEKVIDMILSVSRRTDIPAFFAKWFINRIRAGYVLVRNPMNYHQVSRINLSPKTLDCIVFWTKNARPILPYLDEIGASYPFYFQYTLNAYERDIEQNLPPLKEKIETFQTLSNKIGREKVIWRYDPILLSNEYDIERHIKNFDNLAQTLSPYVESCVFSFFDAYPKVMKNIKACNVRACNNEEMNYLAKELAFIAKKYNLKLKTCAEIIDLQAYGIEHGKCIDPELISRIIGCNIDAAKDKNQRSECGCVESIDIGQYNTCRHGCKYCYANFNAQSVETFNLQHNDESPLLIGELSEVDKVTDRKIKSLKTSRQISLF